MDEQNKNRKNLYIFIGGLIFMALFLIFVIGDLDNFHARKEIQDADRDAKIQEYTDSGINYSERGEYAKAVEMFQKAVNLNQNNAVSHFNLGVAYRNFQEYDKAIKSLQKAAANDPKYINAYSELADIYYQVKKDIPNAVKMYQRIIAIDPNNADAYYKLGFIYRDSKEIDKAIESFQKVVAIDPKNIQAYSELGNIYYGAKHDATNAITMFQKVIEQNPDNFFAHAYLGFIYHDLKEYNNSIENLQKALALNPNFERNYDIYFSLGNIYYDLKDDTNAAAMFKKVTELNPNHYNAYYNLGLACRNLKDYDNSMAAFEKAVAIEPNNTANANAYYSLGEMYLNVKNNYPATIEILKKSLAMNPNNDNAYCNIGFAYASLNDLKEALNNFNKALQINPNNDAAQKSKNLILAQLDKTSVQNKTVNNKPANNNPQYDAKTQELFDKVDAIVERSKKATDPNRFVFSNARYETFQDLRGVVIAIKFVVENVQTVDSNIGVTEFVLRKSGEGSIKAELYESGISDTLRNPNYSSWDAKLYGGDQKAFLLTFYTADTTASGWSLYYQDRYSGNLVPVTHID